MDSNSPQQSPSKAMQCSPQTQSRMCCFKCRKNFTDQNEAFAIADSGEHMCNDCCLGMRKSAHVDDDIFSFGGVEFQPLAGLGSQPHCAGCEIQGGARRPMQQQQGAPAASSGIRQSSPALQRGQMQGNGGMSPQMQMQQQQEQGSPATMARSSCFKCKKGFSESNEAFAIAESGEHICNDCCCEMRKTGHVDDDIFRFGGIEFEPLAGLGSQPHRCQSGGQMKSGLGSGMQGASPMNQQRRM